MVWNMQGLNTGRELVACLCCDCVVLRDVELTRGGNLSAENTVREEKDAQKGVSSGS